MASTFAATVRMALLVAVAILCCNRTGARSDGLFANANDPQSLAQGSADLVDMENANLINMLDIERDQYFLARHHGKPQLLGQQQHALRGLQSEADSSSPTPAPSRADMLDATAAPTQGNGRGVEGSLAPTPSPGDATGNDDAENGNDDDNAGDDNNASGGWRLSVNAVGVMVAVAVVGWRGAWVGEL